MELKDLAGEHELSGVEFGSIPPDRANYEYEDANAMTFVLDGRAYCAIENPGDGYRSCMRDISLAPIESVKNRFVPVRVLGVYRDKSEYGSDDVLEWQ